MIGQREKYYVYGMRLRPAGIGAQPKGFYEIQDPPAKWKRYWDIVIYTRRLTDNECFVYSMDLLDVFSKEK